MQQLKILRARWFSLRLTDYDDVESLGSRLRARRAAVLLEMIGKVFGAHGHVRIIDIGGTERYWNIVPTQFLQRHKASITIVNLPGVAMPPDHEPFTFVAADGCDLGRFADKAFHIAHSNSVLEHVGEWDRMVRFAREISRVSEKYFVQTPNFWFPIEPHCMTPFFHWLPQPTRVWLVMNFRLGNWGRASSIDEAVRTIHSARLLDRRMFQALFDDGVLLTERVFWIPKSFVAIRP